MMETIRYYPLINFDPKGMDYRAMTPANDERTVREHHKLWLKECVPNYYRLGAREKPSAAEVGEMRLRCPKCSAELKTISIVTDERTLPLYCCDECVKRAESDRGDCISATPDANNGRGSHAQKRRHQKGN